MASPKSTGANWLALLNGGGGALLVVLAVAFLLRNWLDRFHRGVFHAVFYVSLFLISAVLLVAFGAVLVAALKLPHRSGRFYGVLFGLVGISVAALALGILVLSLCL